MPPDPVSGVLPGTPSDAFGLSLSTRAPAAVHYRLAARRLLAGHSEAALASFASAVRTDDNFALGHAGVAVATIAARAGIRWDALHAAGTTAHSVTRRERQHVEVVTAAVTGDVDRGLVLGRDHLDEFPKDVVVLHALTSAATGSGEEALRAELLSLVQNLLPAWLQR